MKNQKRWLIVGTDTNAGKTHVACAILGAAQEQGLKAVGYKPVETGAVGTGPDALLMASAATSLPATTYVYKPAMAPSRAAELEGRPIELEPIEAAYLDLSSTHDLVVVEAAGGFLAPLSDHLSVADLASKLGLNLLLVAPDRLGTINHTLLTLEAIHSRNLPLGAVILSQTTREPSTHLDNADQIQRHSPSPTQVLSVPYCSSPAEQIIQGHNILRHLG